MQYKPAHAAPNQNVWFDAALAFKRTVNEFSVACFVSNERLSSRWTLLDERSRVATLVNALQTRFHCKPLFPARVKQRVRLNRLSSKGGFALYSLQVVKRRLRTSVKRCVELRRTFSLKRIVAASNAFHKRSGTRFNIFANAEYDGHLNPSSRKSFSTQRSESLQNPRTSSARTWSANSYVFGPKWWRKRGMPTRFNKRFIFRKSLASFQGKTPQPCFSPPSEEDYSGGYETRLSTEPPSSPKIRFVTLLRRTQLPCHASRTRACFLA